MKNTIFLCLTTIFLFVANNLFSQEKYNPSSEFNEFVEIDLEKELITHKINKENKLAYKYTPTMINEFQQNFFPNENIKWFEPKNPPDTYFFYKAEIISIEKNSKSKKQETKKQEIFLGWQNYSDGLEWNFWVTKLSRIDTKNNNFFEIIKNKKLVESIKKDIKYQKNEKIDVFLHENFTFSTSHLTENIKFPNIKEEDKTYLFGVFYNSKLYFFDEKGVMKKY